VLFPLASIFCKVPMAKRICHFAKNRTNEKIIKFCSRSEFCNSLNIEFNIDPDFFFDCRGFESVPFGCLSGGRGIDGNRLLDSLRFSGFVGRKQRAATGKTQEHKVFKSFEMFVLHARRFFQVRIVLFGAVSINHEGIL